MQIRMIVNCIAWGSAGGPGWGRSAKGRALEAPSAPVWLRQMLLGVAGDRQPIAQLGQRGIPCGSKRLNNRPANGVVA